MASDSKKFPFLSEVVIPLITIGATFYIGTSINTSLKEKDVKLEYVKLAVGVLSQGGSGSSNVKTWAGDVLKKYSDVKISDDALRQIIANGLPLPVSSMTPHPLSKYDELIKVYDSQLALDPNNKLLLNQKGYALYKKGDLETARIFLDKSVSQDEKYEWGHYNLALVYWSLGKQGAAIDEIRKILALNPSFKTIIREDEQFSSFFSNSQFADLMK